MVKRKIIEINRDLCNGCGNCTTACAEGALELDAEGKAVLVRELFCDGMGACLDVCPTDALKIVERDSEAYDAETTADHVRKVRGENAVQHVHGYDKKSKSDEPMACGCPGSMARELVKKPVSESTPVSGKAASELGQWPVQLHLVSPAAPYFNESDLLIAADCTAFACGHFHDTYLKGKSITIACPKLDDTVNYVNKLADIIKNNIIYSVTVVIMSVPCCSSLYYVVEQAVELSGKSIAIKKVVLALNGEAQTD